MRKAITSLALVALLALPGVTTAQAQSNAGVEEYTETFPGAGGNNPSNNANNGGSGSSSGSTGGGPLPPAQITAPASRGADGGAAAQVAQAPGPERRGKGANGSAGSGGPGGGSNALAAGAPGSDSGGSGTSEVIGTLTGNSDSGMGLALPIVLVVALFGALAFLIARRSRSGTAGEAE